jgi:2,4-dienoyl-CoA reductase-like NADH-dependent reductase (Old Yellow Enzyme family)
MNSNSLHKFEPFTYKSLEALKQKINELHLEIPISLNVDILREKVKLNRKSAPNRLAVQPMEGFDANNNGSPSKLTKRRYVRYAEGGVGLIWFEATSISGNCRSNSHQLMLTNKNIKEFKKFVSLIRDKCNKTLKSQDFEEECILILQLNHSGRYSKINGKKHPIRAFKNFELDSALNVSEKQGYLISDDDLKSVEDEWINRAELAEEVGFDGVDIKACHGYLISELLASRTRKDSIYGGNSLENRSKMFLNIIKKLKKKTNDFIITSRLGIYDGMPFPNGFGIEEKDNQFFPAPPDLSEPLELIKNLYKRGIKTINISTGNPHYRPHLTRPYDTPIKGAQNPDEHPLYSVNRMIKLTSMIKAQVPEDMIIIGSGYSYLRQYAGNVVAGLIQNKSVDICGFGRMAIANPNYPKQIFQNGVIDKKKVCITCSKCSELMRSGLKTGCVIRDPQYKK